MPSPSVTAKPLTGPGAELEQRQGRDQRGQVGVDDRAHRLVEAGVDRRQRRSPCRALLADALVDQHVGVDRLCRSSARCRRCRAASASRRACDMMPRIKHHVEHQRDVGDHAEDAIVDQHQRRPRARRRRCRRWCRRGSNPAPSSAPTERSSTTFSGAGKAPARSSTDSSLAVCDGEAAGDDARAAEDRLADVGGRDHLVVEHDRERLADILLRDLAELASTRHCRSGSSRPAGCPGRMAGRRSGSRR